MSTNESEWQSDSERLEALEDQLANLEKDAFRLSRRTIKIMKESLVDPRFPRIMTILDVMVKTQLGCIARIEELERSFAQLN